MSSRAGELSTKRVAPGETKKRGGQGEMPSAALPTFFVRCLVWAWVSLRFASRSDCAIHG